MATLGALVLMALTRPPALVYFRRCRVDHRPWPTVLAQALGLAGLLAFLGLTITNLATPTGGSRAAVGAVLVAFLAAEAAWSARHLFSIMEFT